jgi:hypothetical protein
MPEDISDVIESYMYTHGDMVEDFWVFQGAPQQVFHNTPKRHLCPCGLGKLP